MGAIHVRAVLTNAEAAAVGPDRACRSTGRSEIWPFVRNGCSLAGAATYDEAWLVGPWFGPILPRLVVQSSRCGRLPDATRRGARRGAARCCRLVCSGFRTIHPRGSRAAEARVATGRTDWVCDRDVDHLRGDPNPEPLTWCRSAGRPLVAEPDEG